MATDVSKTLGQLERELVHGSMNLAMGRLENTATLREIRRKYARALTRARQDEIAMGHPKGSAVGVIAIAPLAEGETVEAAPESKGGFLKGVVDRISSGNE